MSFAKDILRDLEDKFLYRTLKPCVVSASLINFDGVDYLNFASNDYLGISARKDWQGEFLKKIALEDSFVMSSTSSRLLAGDNVSWAKLEAFLESLYGKSCLLFNSLSSKHYNIVCVPPCRLLRVRARFGLSAGGVPPSLQCCKTGSSLSVILTLPHHRHHL